MARIFEYQGKSLLKKSGVNIPEGRMAETPGAAREIAEGIGKPVAIKAQVLTTGRFAAGGVKFANSHRGAYEAARDLLGSEVKGLLVKKILVEEMLTVTKEYYAGISIDPSVGVKSPVLVIGTQGGTGIEEIAAKHPRQVFRLPIDPLAGLRPYELRDLLSKTSMGEDIQPQFSETLMGLYNLFRENDASNAEINPVILTDEGKLYAADCHVTIDDNSVFRHPEFHIKIPRDMEREATRLEELAWDHIEDGDYRGTGYFAQMVTKFDETEKYVGFHGIGGGGSMLGAAALINRGIKIANYADTSGDPPASKIYKVIKAIFSLPISAYTVLGACLANQEQWYHAFAIVKALREELASRPGFPVVILLAGNKETEAMAIMKAGLSDLNIRLELYGIDYIYASDFLGQRLEALMDEYLEESGMSES